MADVQFGDVAVRRSGHVAVLTLSRPPSNFVDIALLRDLADALHHFDDEDEVRSIVIAAEGKHFCAGVAFTGGEAGADPSEFYVQAIRIFETRKPIVAAVNGSAIGGGLGLALAADFRVVSPETRMSANFVKIGIHPGFGLTYTLPRLAGPQAAALLFYTGRRIGGVEAVAMGLADMVVPAGSLLETAMELAADIAENAPLAVAATRETLREGLLVSVRAQLAVETREQMRLFATADFQEGVRSVQERRAGQWIGR
jgi:enoyl-CoA hydratase/carnithine racemase